MFNKATAVVLVTVSIAVAIGLARLAKQEELIPWLLTLGAGAHMALGAKEIRMGPGPGQGSGDKDLAEDGETPCECQDSDETGG